MEQPLYTRIFRALEVEIAQGTLAPGDRLMENRLANRFGVSRAPARQALSEMEAAGLVASADAPARGYIVSADAALRASRRPPTPFNSETTPTWQLIYSEVEDVLTQRIAFGSWRLIEASLGKHFGVSRTVAREVLARLQSRGLVLNEGKRWIAPELNDTRVRELYALRALLEPAALEEIGTDAPEAQLSQMIGDLRAAMSVSTKQTNLDQLEADLHFGLLKHCNNSLLRKSIVESQSLLLAHRFFYQHTPDIYPVEPFLEEHLFVLERLQSGAIKEACAGLRDHLLASSERAVLRISKVSDAFSDTPPDYLERIETPS